MKRLVIIVSAVLLLGINAAAQNLNSTVEVTNDYATDFSGLDKNGIPMAIPDSLLQFDRNFDYATFDNPFKGSYEFVPFSVKIRPEPGNYGRKNLWICAGAGYTMHPVLNAVYSPTLKKSKGFEFSLFQEGNGYWGEYRNGMGSGYDFSEKIGGDFRYVGKKCSMTGELMYDGLFRKVADIGNYNAVVMSYKIGSVDDAMKHFFYRLSLDWHYGQAGGTHSLIDHDINFKGTIGPKWGKKVKIPIDFGARYNNQNGYFGQLTPHIELSLGPVDFKGGARFTVWCPFNQNARFSIFPDVFAKWDAVKKYFTIYASATGGPLCVSYNTLLHKNHFSATPSEINYCTADFSGGFRGAAGSVFQWNLSGGYGFWGQHIIDAVIDVNTPGFVAQKMNVAHADAEFVLATSPFDAEIGLHYRKMFLEEAAKGYLLPEFSGSSRLTYNWNRRFYLGAFVEGALQRQAPEGFREIPWYVDLGALVEYRYNSHLSFWLQGGNLLNMEIMRTPLYAEKGINFTAGICFNL